MAMVSRATLSTAPRASFFAAVYGALLGLYILPFTFFAGAMAGDDDPVLLQRVGLTAATVVVLTAIAWGILAAVRGLFRTRLRPLALTVVLTLLTLALAFVSLYPALQVIFWFWPPTP